MQDGMQKQLYGIAIFEEEIVLADYTGDAEKRFVVTPEQLAAFISTEVTFRPFPGLVWMKTSASGDKYLLLLPAAARTILYRRNRKLTTYKMSLPTIAVQANVDHNSRRINSISMWGLAGKELKPDSVLYELPLPNLGGSGLCLGSVERSASGDIRAEVEKMIFDTPFNHHNNVVGKEKIVFHDYVKKYKGRCPFKTLKEIGAGRQLLGGLK